MKRLLLTTTIACLIATPLLAQTSADGSSAGLSAEAMLERAAPRLPNGRPDLSGVWVDSGPITDIRLGLIPGEEIVLLPEAKALMDSRMSRDDPEANCLPTGVPRVAPYPYRFVQAPLSGEPTHYFILFEGNIHSYRQIFMDGREHPEDLDPTWYGHSIGRWEGDTLVIDTVGFNERFWFDFEGHPHSGQLHTIERYTRTNFATLEKVVTIIDPGAYAKPFSVQFDSRLEPDWELTEYICNENNQDVQHIMGPAGQ